MSLLLILIRHAKAASADGRDADRPLTEDGRRQAARLGAYLAARAIEPAAILASTARRAHDTVAHMLPAFAVRPPVAEDLALYMASPEDILDVVRGYDAPAGPLALVGHNPGLGLLARQCAGRRSDRAARCRLAAGFPTAAAAMLEFDIARWRDLAVNAGRLETFVTPADY